MDGTQFDALLRDVSTDGTRRGMFRTMAAAGLGLGLTRAGLDDAFAKKKKKKKKKKTITSPPPPPTKGLLAQCTSTFECLDGRICQPANAQNACFPETVARCCVADGQPCLDNCDCCGVNVICGGNGLCQSA